MLRWIAHQPGTYFVFGTDDMDEIMDPPLGSWNLILSADVPEAGTCAEDIPASVSPFSKYCVRARC